MGAYFIIAVLVVFNVITEKQAMGILAAAVAAKEFGQAFLTPATNQHTPDATPAKPSLS